MPSTRASVRGKCEFYDPQQRQGYLSVAGWAPDVHVLFRAEDVLGPPPAAGSAVVCELDQPRNSERRGEERRTGRLSQRAIDVAPPDGAKPIQPQNKTRQQICPAPARGRGAQ